MSGPKIDSVSIERARAAQLAAERSRNEKMLHDALFDLDLKVCAIKADCLTLSAHRGDFMSEISDIERSAKSAIFDAAKTGYPYDIDEARAFNDKVGVVLRDVVSGIDKKMELIRDRINSAVASQRELESLEAFASRLSAGTEDDHMCLSGDLIHALLERERSAAGARISSLISESNRHVLEDAEAAMSTIRRHIVSDTTDASRKSNLADVVKRLNGELVKLDAGDQDASTVQRMLSGLAPVLAEANTHDEVMKDLYVDCLIQQDAIRQMSGRIVELAPLWKYKEESELEDILRELKETSRRSSEDAYVVYALDEVMARHGYIIARNVQLAGVQQQGHRMFMTEHDDVGIHAFFASGGILAMEVASVDDDVRSSEDGQVVEKHQASSSYDKMRLLEEQRSFCDLHPEIIEDLAAYGIDVGAVKDKAPSEENSVLFKAVHASRGERDEVAERRRAKRSQAGLREREAK